MPCDYDADPGRYRLGMQLTRSYLAAGTTSVYERIWQLLPGSDNQVVADVGCADGALTAARPAARRSRLLGLDTSAVLLRTHPVPAIQADAVRLPLRNQSVTAVVAVNMLYHLPDPLVAIREARRVLAPGGVFVAATISRSDSPELAAVWRPRRSTFDAEDAAALAGAVFATVEVESWDAPLITLPDTAAIRDYLVARQMRPAQAAGAAAQLPAPLTITKRGALLRCSD